MSGIGWVDFSSEHRDKVKSVIDLLSTPGVIDELGIGVVRDSFSDSLFPGISTIQTRAKYFISVPRIFTEYEKLPVNRRRRLSLAKYLNEQENACMKAMVKNHAEDRQDGIIGESFANKQGEVQRKPSSVYWTGIRQFGLIRTNQSLQGFCRTFANPDRPIQDLIQWSDKTKGDDPDASDHSGEKINGPTYDSNWIDSLTVDLSNEESQFLSNQISTRVQFSLMGQILLDETVRTSFLDLPSEWNFTAFADEAPFLPQFPNELQRVISAARDFWQLMHGAHIRYNCLLQDRHGTDGVRKEFESQWDEWLSTMRLFKWDRWRTEFLWELTQRHSRKVRDYTIRFVESWIEEVRANATTSKLDDLVIRQERFNKKTRARLHPAAESSEPKWVGINDLNYRLNVARTIIGDIHAGLTASESADA